MTSVLVGLSCYWQWILSKNVKSNWWIQFTIASCFHSYFDNVLKNWHQFLMHLGRVELSISKLVWHLVCSRISTQRETQVFGKKILTWFGSPGSNTRPNTFCFKVKPSVRMSFKSLIGSAISETSAKIWMHFNVLMNNVAFCKIMHIWKMTVEKDMKTCMIIAVIYTT